MFRKLVFIFGICFIIFNINAIEMMEKKGEKMNEKLDKLYLVDEKVGAGREAETGLIVKVHYTGWLFSTEKKDHKGKKFDSSVDRRQPFEFTLGVGQVIKGWDQGFSGMQVGGKRTIYIPSSLGYGPRGAGDVIPPNADLVFDVELLELH